MRRGLSEVLQPVGAGTRGLENCMRRHGDQLTPRCIKGLVQAGAISQAEVDRRRRELGR